MIKVMMFVKRRPGMSREEFIHHYEEVHAPLSLRLLPHYAKYARNYPTSKIEGKEAEFDCITEIWFKDAKAARSLMEALGGSDITSGYGTEIGRIFSQDEERFMDRGKRTSFIVDERVSDIP